jgi:hypothetical protein
LQSALQQKIQRTPNLLQEYGIKDKLQQSFQQPRHWKKPQQSSINRRSQILLAGHTQYR